MTLAEWSMRVRVLGQLPVAVRYVAAAGIVAVALAVTLLNPSLFAGIPFLAFFPAILLVAVLLDHRASLFAVALSVLLAFVFVIEPRGSLAYADSLDIVRLALFGLVGVFMAAVAEAMRKAVDELSAVNAALIHTNARAEEQAALLATVIEGAGDFIYVKDRDGRFVLINQATAAIFGTTPEQAVGHRDRDYLPAEQASAIEAIDAEVMATRQVRVVEEPIRFHDGRTRINLSTKAPWIAEDGSIKGLIGVSRDINDRKAAEDAVRRADEQKRLLLYDLNHRVKNHLQTVLGPMELAARRADTLEAAREALHQATGRLTVLGRVYTRLQLTDRDAAVDTASFLDELSRDLAASLVDRDIVLRCDAASAPLDSTRAVTLGLLVNELVQNALKYAFPNRRRGTVAVELSRDADMLILTVADDGVGTTPDAPAQGTGTGRRLAQAMARQLGGELMLSGPPGAVWTLRFPAQAS